MYAPIIIPTLSRYEHLVRCVESLKNNPLAAKTEIYISLDFPPAEKYVDGYNKIKKYMETSLSGSFKEVHLYYQKENIGCMENLYFLQNEVYKKFDCYIYTEDDNEFAPNFLDYINKGLSLFKDDKDILAICGCRNEETWDFSCGNVAKVDRFNAWGYATWREKMDACNKWINRDTFTRLLRDKQFCKKLYQANYQLFYAFIEFLLASPNDYKSVYINKDGDLEKIDYAVGIYMVANGKYAIVPEKSKARNWGFDGSGINCVQVDNYDPEKMEIDKKDTFDFQLPDIKGLPFGEYQTNDYKKVANRAKFYRILICMFGLFFCRKVNNATYLLSTFARNLRKRG